MTMLAVIALLCWAGLLFARGGFWRSRPELPAGVPHRWPSVAIVVPARDEAAAIGASLASLLAQDYAGVLRTLVVDDASQDATGTIARDVMVGRPHRDAVVLAGRERPAGWSGKLWAIAQGISSVGNDPEYLLLTDSDIVHEPGHVSALVAKAERDRLDLVSEMVRLNCDSAAEQWLVPAFVYFFQLLYPFAWVNDPLRPTAAAAGGTILIRRAALSRIGGIGALRGALIDDVALAAKVKHGGPIWLGHSGLATSVRRHGDAREIWRMIARTAFVQLRRSWLLLTLCVLGMALTFLLPPLLALVGQGPARLLGLAAWLGMAVSFVPTLRRYGRPAVSAAALPVIALFYMAATIGSALDHARGRGVVWKGRAYRNAEA